MRALHALLLTLSLAALVGERVVAQAQQNATVAIVADVELVQISVLVFDEKGAIVTDLQQSDFRIVEDGVEQRLLYCDSERQPVSFVIVGDISQSMTKKIQFVRDAATSVLNSVHPGDRYEDEYSLFSVESRVTRLVSFTKDQQNVARRLPALLMPTNGGTALFDGVYTGALAAQEAGNNRRAVIVISDGGDNHSRHNLRQTRQLLQEADVPVFAVMAGPQFDLLAPPEQKPKGYKFPIPIPTPDENVIGPAERDGPNNLKALTEVTGGGVFTAHDPEGLARIVRTISAAVRHQYVLSYESQGTPQVKLRNNWHAIRLELIPNNRFKGYAIYYKRGYYKK